MSKTVILALIGYFFFIFFLVAIVLIIGREIIDNGGLKHIVDALWCGKGGC